MNPQFVPYLGPALAAVIAAAAAYLAAVLTKENKISEFRQAWIDCLREDLATLIATTSVLHDSFAIWLGKGKTTEEIHTYLMQFKSEITAAESACARIQLRLNPSEHSQLINAAKAMFVPSEILNFKPESAVDNAVALVGFAQIVLKDEWKRVKSGEPVFRWSKRIAFCLLIVASASLIAMYYYVPGLASF